MSKRLANGFIFVLSILSSSVSPSDAIAAGFSSDYFVWSSTQDAEASVRQMIGDAVDSLSEKPFLASGPKMTLRSKAQTRDPVAKPDPLALDDNLRQRIVDESVENLRTSRRGALLARLSYWSRAVTHERFLRDYFGHTQQGSAGKNEVYGIDRENRFSIIRDQRSRAALRLAAAGARSAIPLLQEAWHREPSPWARMMYEYALALLGDTSVNKRLFKTLLSSKYKTFFLTQSDHPLPVSTAKGSGFFDENGFDADPFTVSLLGLSQANLNLEESETLKNFVKVYLQELLSDTQMARGVQVRQPSSQILRAHSPNFVESAVQHLLTSASILSLQDVFDLVVEHFRAIGHIVGHDEYQNSYNPPTVALTSTLLTLDEPRGLLAINEKLKEIDSVMIKGPRDAVEIDDINSRDPYFLFMYIDHQIVEGVKKRAPVLLRQNRVFQVTPYKTHYGLHIISDPNKANEVMRKHNRERWHEIRDPRMFEAVRKGLLKVFGRSDIGGVVEGSNKESCDRLIIPKE